MENKKNCANCRREFDVGVDMKKVVDGVNGVKDFVPLEKPLFFCCERCIVDYFDTSDLPSMPPRIPK